MRERVLQIAAELSSREMPVNAAGRQEAQDLLRWVADDHFTFLGFREYEVVGEGDDGLLRAVPDTGLGLLRRDDRAGKPRSLKTLAAHNMRSEEHTSELQSLMRISYAVFCLKKKKKKLS